MVTAPEVFGAASKFSGDETGDPCPGVRKYVEVAHKCKPTQFRSRVACQGDNLKITCPDPDTRIAVYSATFAGAAGSHIYCPTEHSPADDAANSGDNAVEAQRKCETSFATEAVMRVCHGQSKFFFTFFLKFKV